MRNKAEITEEQKKEDIKYILKDYPNIKKPTEFQKGKYQALLIRYNLYGKELETLTPEIIKNNQRDDEAQKKHIDYEINVLIQDYKSLKKLNEFEQGTFDLFEKTYPSVLKELELEELDQLRRKKNSVRGGLTVGELNKYNYLCDKHKDYILSTKYPFEPDQKQVVFQGEGNIIKEQKNHLKVLLDAYNLQFGKQEIIERDTDTQKETITLGFENEDEAISFFKEQSNNKVAFDMYCKDPEHRVYSNGLGGFVQGPPDIVSEYLENPEKYNVNEETGALNLKYEYLKNY